MADHGLNRSVLSRVGLLMDSVSHLVSDLHSGWVDKRCYTVL